MDHKGSYPQFSRLITMTLDAVLSLLFFGVLGALYCLLVSVSALQNGPLCLTKSNKWCYPFRNTNGRYLDNEKLWEQCVKPPNIVQWNLDLFALLTALSILELVLCGIQLVNAIIGVCSGDCRKKEAPPPPPSS